jgi:hypothetical protein
MAQVTYRGVKYDTSDSRNRPSHVQFVDEVYRNIKHTVKRTMQEMVK